MSGLPERLRSLRRQRNMTQKEIAEIFGVTAGAWGMWEAGRREPDIDTLHRLADFFGVSTDYLIGRTNEPLDPANRPRNPADRLAELGVTGIWGRGGVTEEDLQFIVTYLETQQRLREQKGKGDKG